MFSFRDRRARVLAPIVIALLTSATVVPTLGAPHAAASKTVVDHWPPNDDDVYGPHFITANPSSDTWYEDLFSVHPVAGAKYYLKVNNPAPGSTGGPVANFSVMLNRVYVANPSMMAGQSELVKEVTLTAWDSLEVWTAPGSGQLRVMITRVPMTHMAPAYAERVQPPAGQSQVTKSWQVTVPPDAGGNRVLVIDNGNYDRTGRIGTQEWVEVKINGARVALLDSLHLNQSKWVMPVALPNGTSTIQTTLGQAIPGAHIHVRVMHADTAKPKLTVSAPANGAVVSSPSVTVSGTYNDPMWGSVRVGTAQSHQTVWMGHLAGVQSWSVLHPLNEGPNTIKIWARDGAGNTSDTVTRVVTRQSATPGMTVAVRGRNPGVTIERDECLTIAAGAGAAYECGDLRLHHELPATRTMNRERAPVLLYNSSHAKARAIIAADVTVPAGTNATSLEATVSITGKPSTVRSFAWNAAWSGGPPRRIVVPIDGRVIGLSTGMFAYTIQVRALGGSTTPTASDTGTVVIVDRSASPFGAGWWLAGLEQLVPVDSTRKLWIGGDGSSRLYVRKGPTSDWMATPMVDRPDTLIQTGSGWRRKLRNGAYVEFDAANRHVATVNRQAHRTSFGYVDSTTLSTIALPVPPGSTASRVYTFKVSGTPSRVDSVMAPARPGQNRSTVLAYRPGTRWVERITDPDGRFVVFRYDAADRIDGRQNRRTHWTFYAYNEAELLRQVTVDMPDPELDIVTGFCPAESRSVAACASGPKPLDSVYTHLDGPRSDVPDTVTFVVNRFGAPSVIVNALGYRTTIERSDTTFAMLATAVVQPNGFRTEATYTNRGLPETITEINPRGDGLNAVTRYEWHATWDEVTKITQPENNSVSFDYDAAGDRVWQQPGSDPARRVVFTNHPSTRLMATITQPGATRPDSVAYDGALGNLAHIRTPRGFLTLFIKDFFGRDSLSFSAPSDTIAARDSAQVRNTGMMQSYTYDVMDRVRETRSVGQDGMGTPALVVLNDYDEEGNVKHVERKSEPDIAGIGSIVNSYEYDAAGRKTAEIAVDGRVDRTYYDRAGNVDSVRTRRGHKISMVYDTLNRVIKRRMDPHYEAPRRAGISEYLSDFGGVNPPYPRYPTTDSTGYLIPADSSIFSYDSLGRITLANNSDARVRRGYMRNGLLAAETTYVRTVEGNNFSQHEYVVGYRYDLNGRRTELRHPPQLAPSSGSAVHDVTRYGYDAGTGELVSVTDPLNKVFEIERDFAGQLSRIWFPYTSPMSRQEVYGYDDDGNQTLRRVRFGLQEIVRDTKLAYDARGKVTLSANALGTRDTLRATYTGLGHVATSRLVANGFSPFNTPIRHESVEWFSNDALANVTRDSSGQSKFYANGHGTSSAVRTNQYEIATGRLLTSRFARQIDTTAYDAAGNVLFTWRPERPGPGTSTVLSDRMSYYDAVGQLRAADHRQVPWGGEGTSALKTVFEEYRYDALGRRIFLRSRRYCQEYQGKEGDECNISFVRRTVWDGDEELYEIQMPDGVEMENDTTLLQARPKMLNGVDPNLFFGRVVYTHGPALDQPLGVTRVNYRQSDGIYYQPFTIVPLWNSRGQPDMGYIADGTPMCQTTDQSDCVLIDWPIAWSVFGVGDLIPLYFHGSLLHDKRDKAGTLYRRNRHYDPQTGRFTQEDPIGLAGGLNLYGFAEGDPVSYADPFGLCPRNVQPGSREAIICAWIEAGLMGLGSAAGFAAGGGSGLVTGPGAVVASPAGAAWGTAVGGAIGLAAGRSITNVLFSRSGRHTRDKPDEDTENWSAHFGSEREARDVARKKIGKDPVEVEPGKWRSQDGRWQYRAKPGDIRDRHIHLEQLDPETGRVIQNVHLRW